MKFFNLALLALASVAYAQDDVDDEPSVSAGSDSPVPANNDAYNKCLEDKCKGDLSNLDCAAMCAGNPNPNPEMINQTQKCYNDCMKQFTDGGERGTCYQNCNKQIYNPSGVIVSSGHPIAEGVSSKSAPAVVSSSEATTDEEATTEESSEESTESTVASSASESATESVSESASKSASKSAASSSDDDNSDDESSDDKSDSEESGSDSDEDSKSDSESESDSESGAARLTVASAVTIFGVIAVALF